jgi:hypothetical protein
MYPTRTAAMVGPVAAGVWTFGNGVIVAVSALGLLLVLLLAARLRAPARPGSPARPRDPATRDDRLTEGRRA